MDHVACAFGSISLASKADDAPMRAYHLACALDQIALARTEIERAELHAAEIKSEMKRVAELPGVKS